MASCKKKQANCIMSVAGQPTRFGGLKKKEKSGGTANGRAAFKQDSLGMMNEQQANDKADKRAAVPQWLVNGRRTRAGGNTENGGRTAVNIN